MTHRLYFELRYLLGAVPWDTGITPPELVRFIHANPAGLALDMGCGTGTNALTLARHGWKVTGVDFSAQAIARARRKARKESLAVNLIQGDVSTLDELSGPYDLCLDIGCYHSLPLSIQAAYAARLGKLLRRGGTYLVYSFLSPEGELDPRWPSEANLRQRFNELFETVSFEHGSDQHRSSAWITMRRKA